MRSFAAVAALLLAASMTSVVALASPMTAQFRVQVTDPRNVSVPEATVTIYTLDGKPGVTIKADERGVATFESVTPGITQVVVRGGYFAPTIEKVSLQAGENSRTLTLHAPTIEFETSEYE